MKGNVMKVYTDRIRIANIIMVHILFIVGLIWLLLNSQFQWFLSLMIIAVIALFAFITVKQFQKFADKKLFYEITPEGITDYSHDANGSHMSWENVNRLEMIANQSDFQIMITGKNEEMPFVVVVIDRFSLRWRTFSKIWKEIRQYSKQYDIELIDNRVINKPK